MEHKDLDQRIQENKCEPNIENRGSYQKFFYKVVEYALKIRKSIRDSQPEYYKEFNL
jgi:hypothetical protein